MNSIWCLLITLLLSSVVYAGDNADRNYAGMKLIGEIKVVHTKQNFDKTTLNAIDSVAAALKKMPKDAPVRIEAYWAGENNPGEFVNKSLLLAESVENYLRSRHNLDFEYYLSVRGDEAKGDKHNSVRIFSLPTGFFDK